MIRAPTIANELISNPINSSILSPMKRNVSMIIAEAIEAFSDSIFPNLLRRSKMIGVEPMISIMANNVKKQVNVCWKEKDSIIVKFFSKVEINFNYFMILE